MEKKTLLTEKSKKKLKSSRSDEEDLEMGVRPTSSWTSDFNEAMPSTSSMENESLSESTRMLQNLHSRRQKTKRKLQLTTEDPVERDFQIEVHKTAIRERLAQESTEDTTEVMTLQPDDGNEGSSLSPTQSNVRPLQSPGGDSTRGADAWREKIRSRMQLAKEKAETQVAADSKAKTRLKFLRERSLARTRFDEALEEDTGLDKVVKQVLQKRQLESGTLAVEGALDLPTEEEAIDFFTKEWDEPQAATQVQQQTPTASPQQLSSQPSIVSEGEETSPRRDITEKVSSFELACLESKWDSYFMGSAKPVDMEELLDRENQIYFFPAITEAPIAEKLQNDQMAPRYCEEEGLYIGQKPYLSSWNRNRVENRLLRSKEFDFFGEDAEVVQQSIPSEISDHSSSLYKDCSIETVYCKAIPADLDGMGRIGNDSYQLELNVNYVVFNHHHLFNTEQVIASELIQVHQKYMNCTTKNQIPVFFARLQALREAIASILEDLEVKSDKLDSEIKGRLQSYWLEMRKVRKQLDEEEHLQRTLLKSVLNLWKDLKNQRMNQQYTTTNIRVQINRMDTNKEDDEQTWNEEITAEIEEQELAFRIELLFYQQQPKRPKRSKKKKSHSEEDGAPEVPKPRFNKEQVQEAVTQKALQNKRRPGEPKLFPVINQSTTISDPSQCPLTEQKRYRELEKMKFFLRITFNNKEVARTSGRYINNHFTVAFNQIFKLQIFQWPESIVIEVYEKSFLTQSFISAVFVPVPGSSVTNQNVEFKDLDFTSTVIKSYNHSAVGSGSVIPLKDKANTVKNLMTMGCIRCSACWGLDESNTYLGPPPHMFATFQRNSRDPIAAIGAAGLADPKQLRAWLKDAQLDPNDPTNSAFLHLLDPYEENEVDYFHLDQFEEYFTTDDALNNNRRFRLLHLRDSAVPEFYNFKMVPNNEREIPEDIFKTYDEKVAEEQAPIPVDDIEAHRARVKKHLNKIHEQISRQYRYSLHQKKLEDIVAEEQVPDISTLSLTILNIAEPRRPLRPIRKMRKKAAPQIGSGSEVSILVNVVQGYNVPVRREAESYQRLASPTRSNFNINIPQSLVRPFIEVSFQRTVIKTNVAEGPNPTWNQSIKLPFQPPNGDLSSNNLQKVRDIIYFNLFDEIRIDILKDERDRDLKIHERIERHWLGSLQIPFTTLYLNSCIEGTFKLNVPALLLDYNWMKSSGTVFERQSLQPESTYISLFITVDPILTVPSTIATKFDSEESERLLHQADKWMDSIRSSFPDRSLKTTVVDINGLSVFVTRFVRSLNPPEEIATTTMNPQIAMDNVARYVSLIPTVKDYSFLTEMCDIWSTCDQFLQILSGSEAEHAILMCNYFLYLGIQAWLLLGFAIPEGPTVYVLTKDNDNSYWVWNVSTGERFNIRDHFNSLISVGCLINETNIWANIQSTAHPASISYDLSKPNLWKPFFSRNYPHPGLTSVQPQHLLYKATSEDFVKNLRERIERNLRENLMSWRSRFRTPWNRFCSQALLKVLPKLEKLRTSSSKVDGTLQEELQDILASYKMSGFPIDMPYIDMETIFEAIFATGVHLIERPDIEFALAVYVHPYPNNVLAVWIYIATLVKR